MIPQFIYCDQGFFLSKSSSHNFRYFSNLSVSILLYTFIFDLVVFLPCKLTSNSAKIASWYERPGSISILFTKLGAFDINRSSILFFRVGFAFYWCRPKSSKIANSFRASPGVAAPVITSSVSQSIPARFKSPARMMCPFVVLDMRDSDASSCARDSALPVGL